MLPKFLDAALTAFVRRWLGGASPPYSSWSCFFRLLPQQFVAQASAESSPSMEAHWQQAIIEG
jgi:hypothetical protein